MLYQSQVQRARGYRERGDLGRAERMLLEIDYRIARLFPADHPAVGIVASERAAIALAQGDFARARDQINRAVAIAEANPSDRDGMPRHLLRRATIAFQAGDLDAATVDATAALKLFREVVGQDTLSSYVGLTYLILGRSLMAAGRTTEARAALASALRHLESALGADHPETSRARVLLGNAP